MAATFSTVLRQSWMSGFDDPSTLLELVERFEPDLVLVTVIERDFFDERLALSPPD